MDEQLPASSSCPGTAAWLLTAPRVPGALDAAALALIGEALMQAGHNAAQMGWHAEFHGALVKVLAAVVAAPVADMTEGDAFSLSQALREALYLELLRFRRAAQSDYVAGAFDA